MLIYYWVVTELGFPATEADLKLLGNLQRFERHPEGFGKIFAFSFRGSKFDILIL